MNIGIVEILNGDEVETVKKGVYDCVNLWKKRQNWHPGSDLFGTAEDIESYMHYSTLGATLYMDASDNGWSYYKKHKDIACLLYTSPSPRDGLLSRMPSSA